MAGRYWGPRSSRVTLERLLVIVTTVTITMDTIIVITIVVIIIIIIIIVIVIIISLHERNTHVSATSSILVKNIDESIATLQQPHDPLTSQSSSPDSSHHQRHHYVIRTRLLYLFTFPVRVLFHFLHSFIHSLFVHFFFFFLFWEREREEREKREREREIKREMRVLPSLQNMVLLTGLAVSLETVVGELTDKSQLRERLLSVLQRFPGSWCRVGVGLG